MWFAVFRGSEDFLLPLHTARNLMESLAADEQEFKQSGDRSRYIVRGPILGRMELVRQLYFNGMECLPINLGTQHGGP